MSADVSRAGRRVDPVPSPFVLSPEAARGSRLHRRMVFLALEDESAARRLLDAFRSQAGVRVGPGPSHLFDRGLLQPWGAFQQDSDVGLSALLGSAEFLSLLRGLADDLLLPAAAHEVLVEWTPQHRAPRPLAAMRSLYPDAVIVTEQMSAAEILAQTASPDAAADTRHQEEKPAASPMRDRLLVIVGAGRSGTTWLEELLLAYDDMGGLSGHETWLFHQLRHLWRNQAGDDGPGLGDWVDRDRFVDALRRFCDGVLAAAQQRHAPQSHFYVEKTPAHVERLPEIAAVYPDAWVVHLLRDGRDVARSMSQVPFFDVAGPADAAALWRRVVRRVRVDAPVVPRFREVRYESLHADPAAVLHELRAWVDAKPHVDPPRLDEVIRRRVSTHAGTAVDVGPDSWRSLPPAVVAGIYAAAGDELIRTGYARRTQAWRARLRPAAMFGQRSRKPRTAAASASGSSTQGK